MLIVSRTQSRGQQLAEAFAAIAKTDHYMVGLTETITEAELEEAEQLLIQSQNSLEPETTQWLIYDLALDLIEYKHKELRRG